MAQNDVYRVLIVWSNANTLEDMSSAFYVRQDSVSGFGLAEMGDAVKAWWDTQLAASGLTAGMKELYPAQIKLERVTLRKVKPLEPVETVYSTGLPIAGTDVSHPLASQASILVSLRTAKIGRSYRGRMYLPAPAEAELDHDFTVARAEDVAQQTAELLENTIESALYDISAVVYSKLLDTAEPITVVKVDRFLRTQRRRAINSQSYSSVTF